MKGRTGVTFFANSKPKRGQTFRRSLAGFLSAAAVAMGGVGFLQAPTSQAGETGKVASVPKDRLSERSQPRLSSRSFLVMDAASSEVLLARNEDAPRSIASLTKLMSAMVYLDMQPDLNEVVEITREDRRGARPAHTRLAAGWKLSAGDLLHAALIASENPAVEALARSTGLSRPEFVGLMNRKAQDLGMFHSIFFDATGLDANNTATARDVARMLDAAARYPRIVEVTTLTDYEATVQNNGKKLHYVNSNRLARSTDWEVVAGKTGYISDAGYCLAVSARSEDRELLMVFLGAPARLSRFGDAARAVAWVKEGQESPASTPELSAE